MKRQNQEVAKSEVYKYCLWHPLKTFKWFVNRMKSTYQREEPSNESK